MTPRRGTSLRRNGGLSGARRVRKTRALPPTAPIREGRQSTVTGTSRAASIGRSSGFGYSAPRLPAEPLWRRASAVAGLASEPAHRPWEAPSPSRRRVRGGIGKGLGSLPHHTSLFSPTRAEHEAGTEGQRQHSKFDAGVKRGRRTSSPRTRGEGDSMRSAESGEGIGCPNEERSSHPIA